MATDTASTSTSVLPGGEERQIAVRLTTKDSQYSIPPTKFLVPASWRRYHLSELINKVLENATPVPFDFVINSSLLRSTLGQYCQQTGTSEEITLEIEYLPSTLPPQLDSTLPSQDWVSDVSLAVKDSILSASYAGTLSLVSPNLPTSASPLTFNGHDQSVLSCTYVSHPLASAGKQWVASGGMDRIARVWEYDSSPSATTVTPQTLYTLPLHSGPISSVRARPTGITSTTSPHILTAGWDGVIGVWNLTPGINEGQLDDADEFKEDGQGRKKKRRKQQTTEIKSKSAVNVLRGHQGKISSAIFDSASNNTVYSTGWDHTVRSWDLETGVETASKTCDKVLYSLSQMATPNLLATGTSDRLICFFDLRTSSETFSTGVAQNITLTMSGHTGPVSAVKSHPTSSLMLVSGSFDGTVRIWDARSPKQALFVLSMPDLDDSSARKDAVDKVLSVDWDGERIAAGGQGAKVVQWKVSESGGVQNA
ncbi:ribosome biogenesis protein ytm1 [Microbotryomycetes sp. JL221]|nr:ribosome biogenesis protein ytm1 [Microbotryomycetes sp. JL221]